MVNRRSEQLSDLAWLFNFKFTDFQYEDLYVDFQL